MESPNKRLDTPEINASSMADIAFLLLIFFLVSTSMQTDKGILVTLPPLYDGPIITKPENQRNVLEIYINASDRLLVENKDLLLSELRELTRRHVDNYGADINLSDHPEKAIVSISHDVGTAYDTYISVYNEIRAAYRELREIKSERLFNRSWQELSENEQKEIRAIYPLRISEATTDFD